MTVEIIHDHLGYRLAEEGTHAYRAELEELAATVKDVAPGAAAALVDWDGAEVARLRAYAVVSQTVRARVAARSAELQSGPLERGSFRLIA